MTGIVNRTNNRVSIADDFMKNSELTLTEKSLYLLLASYCKEGENFCSPSLKKDLVSTSGVTIKTLIGTIDKLIQKGYLVKEERTDALGGRLPNKYILLK